MAHTFKVGDRVKIIGNHLSNGEEHPRQAVVGKIGTITDIVDGTVFPYTVYLDDDGSLAFLGSDLALVEKTFDNLVVGDVLLYRNTEYTVLGVITPSKLYVLSMPNRPDKVSGDQGLFTVEELADGNFTIKQPEPPIAELTIDQIAEKFNLKPEHVRIKKEQ